ncbi:T9SS type A sorting domain-containing protein [Hymenobacter setariae]|uniref:T9SS type A sorting domain-containing protein n=1 Tax=Hymenobacter setariae TaxID=2594794 RepID=UPI001F1CA02C|nr:T9SS type A sorting domain-containing protein [Hymenobacter setariae]
MIQYSEAHHNESGSQFDGGGFDLDGGCTNSVMQYNYSHDNSGPGFLLSQYYGAYAMHDLIVRYNVSDNDARRNSQGALEVWSSGASGGIVNAAFYNNTVRLGTATDNSQAKAVKVMSCDYTNLSFRNNVFKTSGGVPAFSTICSVNLSLQGNSYWNSDQAFYINWNGAAYYDLAAFRAATGQERMSDGRLTGISNDPQLPNANLAQAPLYSSPLRQAGINLWAEFKVDPGTHDFANTPLPTAPTASSVGAFEISEGPLPVVLTGFTAQRTQAGALLRWGTASEQNNAYFTIEFSLDGRVFTPLAQVSGQGTSAQAHAYQYTDAKLNLYPAQLVYYRLHQVDTNNQGTYSPVCTLRNDGPATAQLQVYPSPAAAATIVLVAGATDKTVQLLNTRGQLLAIVPTKEDGTAEILTAGLAPGLYLVRNGAQSAKLLLTP